MNFLGGKDIVLTDREQSLLDRWQYCNDLIRSNEYSRAEIMHQIIEKFAISRPTASSDIADTHFVFGSSIRYNKNYLIVLHIDQCDDFIRKNQNNEKKLDAVMRMFDVRRRYVEMLEAGNDAKDLPPVAIRFTLNQTNIALTVNPDNALDEASRFLEAETIEPIAPEEP